MIRLLLVRRRRGGGNMHGQRYARDGGLARRNGGGRLEEFEACSLFSPYPLISQMFFSPRGERSGGVQQCGGTVNSVQNIINCATLLRNMKMNF